MNRNTGYRLHAALAFRGGKWFIELGNEIIPLAKVTGPLKNGLIEAGKLLEANASKMALPAAALLTGVVIGVCLGSQGKEKEKEARLAAEMARNQVLQEQETLIEENQRLGDEFKRGYEVVIPATPETRASLREQLDIRNCDVNIAVVGRVNSGKTSFINSCRGLLPGVSAEGLNNEDSEFDYGEVSNKQTTVERYRYRSMKTPNIAWWDMPGILGGNATNPIHWTQCYYNTFNLTCYDFVLLLHNDPFAQPEATIGLQYLEGCQGMHDPPPLLFVRTKTEQNLAMTANDKMLQGDELLNVFRADNSRDIALYMKDTRQPSYLVSRVGLWEVSTGKAVNVNGQLAEHFDEEQLFKALGVPVGEI